jgi:hypothetical protein
MLCRAEEGSEVCLAYMYVWVEADRDLGIMSNESRRYTIAVLPR